MIRKPAPLDPSITLALDRAAAALSYVTCYGSGFVEAEEAVLRALGRPVQPRRITEEGAAAYDAAAHRLIDAAPELLAALQSLVSAYETEDFRAEPPEILAARKAIAKTTGKAGAAP